ncbi:hypothetical protein BT96DRAFT_991440 [Gymnopus androsaceus JB14]|uniref:Uncharacterized protein n=1 Tax=Gymnopus androsaceus JB14 TaxID=1447944 RepID=A0A6A4HY34_9AGAR|nr:hypothetical protein BT96DRAFT_991440 [Gymnopus androsaceus JB14]
MPGSPLTPAADIFPPDMRAKSPIPILTLPPHGALTISSLNLHPMVAKSYRVIAKSAIVAFC